MARPGRDDEGRPGGYADDKRVTVKGMTRLVWDSVNRAVIFLRLDGPGELDVHIVPVLLAGPNGHAGDSEPTFAFNTPSLVTDSILFLYSFCVKSSLKSRGQNNHHHCTICFSLAFLQATP